MDDLVGKRLLLVDSKKGTSFWKEGATKTLQEAGVDVLAMDGWNPQLIGEVKYDIAFLVCYQLDESEMEIFDQMRRLELRVVVVKLSLRWNEMRQLFLRGAFDVVEKTFDNSSLLSTVAESLRRAATIDAGGSWNRLSG